MTHVLHAAWDQALATGRGVYVIADADGWHLVLSLRKGCRLMAIVGMRGDGRPWVTRWI